MIQINFFALILIGMVFVFMAIAIWCLAVDLKEIEARNDRLIEDNIKKYSERMAKKFIDSRSRKP